LSMQFLDAGLASRTPAVVSAAAFSAERGF
jgi:hypothetical protein